jgi:CelD/BcsL family acetyltransferase involved in cellulose biosynthesis
VRRYAAVEFTILHNGIYLYLADGLIDPACRDRVTVEEIANLFGPWDVLHLARLRVGSSWLGLTDCSKYVRREPGRGIAVLDTSIAFDERWAQMPKKLRSSIRNARNRIKARGGARVSIAIHDDLVAAFDRHVALESAGWKGAHDGALANAHWKRNPWAAYLRESRTAQIHALYIDGTLAASICGAVHAGTFAAMYTTYDESFSDLSPGSVLWAELISSCCADPTIQRIDCLAWHPWLERWAFDQEPTYELLAFNSGVRGKLTKIAYRTRAWHRSRRSWSVPRRNRRPHSPDAPASGLQ